MAGNVDIEAKCRGIAAKRVVRAKVRLACVNGPVALLLEQGRQGWRARLQAIEFPRRRRDVRMVAGGVGVLVQRPVGRAVSGWGLAGHEAYTAGSAHRGSGVAIGQYSTLGGQPLDVGGAPLVVQRRCLGVHGYGDVLPAEIIDVNDDDVRRGQEGRSDHWREHAAMVGGSGTKP